MPKISIVIPIYNTEPYLRECLDSVTGQTLQDIEIVCVNDGSTDGSGEILKEFAARDPRLVVIDQENRGLSAARNAGVAAAHGEYLDFVDSDDCLELNTLEVLYEEATANDLDVLYFDAITFFEDEVLESENAGYRTYYQRAREYDRVMTGGELLAEMDEDQDHKPSPCLQLIRRRYYEAAGLYFYVGIVHEDNLFSFLTALQADRTKHVPWPLYRRRVRRGSIMTAPKDLKNFRGFFITYLEMMRFMSQRSFDEKTAIAAANVCSEMYRQALKVLVDLHGDEWDAAGHIDSSPEAIVTHTSLVREAYNELHTRKLEKSLKKTTKQLESLRGSRWYRTARFVRGIFKPRG